MGAGVSGLLGMERKGQLTPRHCEGMPRLALQWVPSAFSGGTPAGGWR